LHNRTKGKQMRPVFTALLGLIILLLWFASATLIAAPANVVQMMIPGSLNLSRTSVEMLGLVLFLFSMLLVMIWALSGSESEDKKSVTVTTGK